MDSKNLTTNKKLVLKATEYARALLKIDKDLWVFINEINHFKGIELEELSYDPNYLITKQSLLESNGSNTVTSNRSLRRKINSFYRQKNNNPG